MNLKGKVYTGGAPGIGRAAALRMAEEGDPNPATRSAP
jgi:NAD(P)-dependent dehydrogenase (short-subunit alcohol dehydrogenase family)